MLAQGEGGEPQPLPPEEESKPERLYSLDIFRGVTIVLMLLVNNMALDKFTPDQLFHAPWNGGVRVADLVYPWFLLAVGLAIPYSLASFRCRHLAAWRYDIRVLWRGVALVLLGCLIDSSTQRTPVFGLGVLQLIGFAYFFGALMYDLSVIRRLFVAALLLVGYWVLIKFVPAPGMVAGAFEEKSNLIAYLNATHLQALHLNGALAIAPTTALVLIGSVLGNLLLAKELSREWKGALLFLVGAALIGLGMAWNLSLPYNKNVWTPSYILFTGGTGTCLFSILYFLCDIAEWRAWAYALAVFGSNAILAYVAPILAKTVFLDVWRVGNVSARQAILDFWVVHTNRIAGGWLYVIVYIVAWWFVLWLFYRKRIFVRV
jgi:predicted acyltransferase